MAKPLENTEIDAIRGFCNRVGVSAAADALGITRTSLLGILSGLKDPPVNDGTLAIVREAVGGGALKSTPPTPRAEARPAKVRA
jgi:hypothetical protein